MRKKTISSLIKGGLVVMVFWPSIILGLPASGQEAQETRNQLAGKIRDTVKEIHALRMERLLFEEQHHAALAETVSQIERLKEDAEITEAALREEQKVVDDMAIRLEKNKKANLETKRLLTRVVDHALPVINRTKERLDNGIPYRKRERQANTEQIICGLTQPALRIRTEALIDGLSFFDEELRLAHSINLWNEPVLLDGGKRRIHAYQVRLGLVEQFFISEDGRETGMAAKEPGLEWNQQPDLVQQEQIETLFNTLQERRPPAMIPVPIRSRRSGGLNREP